MLSGRSKLYFLTKYSLQVLAIWHSIFNFVNNFKKPFPWKYFVQHKFMLYLKHFYELLPQTIIYSSLVICYSGNPCFTSNVFRVDRTCKNLIKFIGFFFAFTNEKRSIILKEYKVAANICNVTDRKKAFVLFFLRIHLASD